jgi:hypothetical protein
MDALMEPTRELIKQLYADKLRQAREMSGEEKLLAGPQLFELGCRVSKDGIRDQFPNADEVEVDRILDKWLSISRRLRNRRS